LNQFWALNNNEEKQLKKAFFILSIVASLFLFSFGYYNYAFYLKGLGILEIISGLAVLLNTIVFFYFGSYSFHSSVFLFITSIILSILVITGGIHKTGIFWIYLYPVVVSLLKRFNKAVVWNIYFVILLVLITIADLLDFICCVQ